MKKTLIKHIGTIGSGDISCPILEGNSILIEDGIITAIGTDLAADDAVVIDANGTTATPGLIDSHVHTTIGDFAPRQKTMDFISSALHGGVTTMISAGECHLPGRPKDPAGTKALAVLASKSFRNARPSGVKVHGGSLILEKGLVEEDFAELQKEGVWIVGEIGLGSVKKPEDAAPMVEWAHKHGFKVQMHTGGTSIPGSSTVTADDVIATGPDVVSHINGGPTAISLAEVDRIMDETPFALEIVQCGNPKVADYVAKRAAKKDMLGRVIFGNDAPSGTGLIPLGILRNICQLSSISNIPPEIAICMASGNTANVYNLNTGIIAVGKEADLILMDAPMGSVGTSAFEAIEAGDIPGISMVLIDGEILVNKSRNTPPAVTPAVKC
ncbi:amidohydrolase family protein [Hespellia stercorisuis]|uniref:Enamidase n=1 Tax=Hespellia stercorisuis DSM 15480 TaxID=1121950 RepID=A0A1M6VE85_9FIRM|nr:amidohydrolase family protein [Hespellia stercorisuis]SHK79769.1 enamidase [Hespellia stercorisuis DSM 15480]